MRYYFDYVQNGQTSLDMEGVDLPDDSAARFEASRFLAEIATTVFLDDGSKAIGVAVRNADKLVITSVGFSLTTGSLGGTKPFGPAS